jgi:hypothetical protein
MRVYVVMSNDYPDCVFSREMDADAYCRKKRDEQKSGVKIHYRSYPFDVDQQLQKAGANNG